MNGLDTTPSHIEVAGASKRYSAATVLDGINLRVEPGALVTILGPSGCGKTTLLRMIAGLELPDEGTVSIAGRDVTRLPPNKRNVGVVFQNYALFPHLSIRQNVAFGLSVRRVPRDVIAAKVARALSLVQLDHLSDRAVSAMSGGQQQRVALARVLAVEPDVVLFDEALSALDRNLRETMQVELRRLLKTIGATALFVTHDQDEALTMSDKIAVMNRGRIEQYADPISLYARPESLFTMRFVGLSTELRGTVKARSNGEVSVDTPHGAVVAQGKFIAGSPVIVATRPEHIRIVTPGSVIADSAVNAIDGNIRHIAFYGSRTRVSVGVAQGQELSVELTGVEGLPAAGDAVRLIWRAEHSFAYPEGAAS